MSEPSPPENVRKLLDESLEGVDPADQAAQVSALGAFRRAVLKEARDRFGPEEAGVPCGRFLCAACDAMVRQAAAIPPPGAGATAWIAAGGYGTGLMSPGSAARLVLLHDGTDPDRARAAAQQVCAALGRAGLRAAAGARSLSGVLSHMEQDAVGALSLLETRLVAGAACLHERFREAVANRFLPERWGSFAEEVLREAVSRRDPFTGSPYSAEPNLKDGAGGLRDLGTAQRLSASLAGLEAVRAACASATGGLGLLSLDESAKLKEALDFLMRVRNALHFVQEDRSDVLHRRVQATVAERLGFDSAGGGVPVGLMRELFRHTGWVAGLLRCVEERFQHVHRVAWRRPAPLPRRDLGHGFVEVEGKIYSALQPPLRPGKDAVRAMQLFRLSQRRHLPVSRLLLDQVGAQLDLIDDAFRTDKEAGAVFLDLLAGSVGVADRVGWMRDCGLLQAYLPEFAPLVHRMGSETVREHSLDEHAVEALRVIDDLGHSQERSELAQRQTLEQVGRPDLVRLALLLHDVDAVTGSDCQTAGDQVAARIGLKPAEAGDLLFLLGNRHALARLAAQGRSDAHASAEELCRRIGRADRLRMLYLLTYAHARAMGPLGWFAWRDMRIQQVYQALMAVLAPGQAPFATAEHFERELADLARAANRGDEVRRFLELLPAFYKTEVPPDEALTHLDLIERTRTAPAAMRCVVGTREARAWVCTSDVPARFAQIAAVFTYNGLDITSATAFTLTDDTVLDRFTVHVKGRPINPDPAYWEKVEGDLVASIRGELNVSAAVREKVAAERASEAVSSRRSVTTVHFDNESDPACTILDIMTWDRTGLLFDVADTLGALGLNIELARIVTRAELAQDVFFLNDSASGRKVTDERRLSEVRGRLLQVCAPAAADEEQQPGS